MVRRSLVAIPQSSCGGMRQVGSPLTPKISRTVRLRTQHLKSSGGVLFRHSDPRSHWPRSLAPESERSAVADPRKRVVIKKSSSPSSSVAAGRNPHVILGEFALAERWLNAWRKELAIKSSGSLSHELGRKSLIGTPGAAIGCRDSPTKTPTPPPEFTIHRFHANVSCETRGMPPDPRSLAVSGWRQRPACSPRRWRCGW